MKKKWPQPFSKMLSKNLKIIYFIYMHEQDLAVNSQYKLIWQKCQTNPFTGWNDKIVVLKKITLQLYFKTFIQNINSGNFIM